MAVLKTYGTIAGYSVTSNRRPVAPGDGIGSTSAVTVALTNGATSYDAFVTDDTTGAEPAAGIAANAILKAFAAIGASVTLGTAGQSPGSNSTSGGTAYTRAVPLTPGTPLPPGRGAFVTMKGGNGILLKLAGGGSIPAYDPSSGSGFPYNNYAVVDADISNNPSATVQILY